MRFFNEFLNREMTVPEPPRRIVSLAPDMTDMVFRLGLGEALVGISSFCRRPAGALEGRPRVGSYLKVAWERLDALQPDLVLTTLGAQRETAYRLLEKGYPVIALPVPLSLWEILGHLRRLGAAVGRTAQAEAENARLSAQLQSLRGALTGPRVYWEVDLGGPITAGAASFVTDALHWLGLRNIYGDRSASYFEPDDAETRALGPDLILYEPKAGRGSDPARRRDALRQRLGLPDTPIVVLPHDSLAHYGPALIAEVLPAVVAQIQEEVP
ncbi:MAG: ABC transporter substrate-binding protein [Chloroflexi bacterium]|nr:ABC transporter substrate-binding protein [Chloroflexota bacterium]